MMLHVLTVWWVFADVQRRAASDGGAAGVGPQHLHVVPLPVRGAVPRVGRLRVRGGPVAGRARVPRRRGRAALRQALPARGECVGLVQQWPFTVDIFNDDDSGYQ